MSQPNKHEGHGFYGSVRSYVKQKKKWRSPAATKNLTELKNDDSWIFSNIEIGL